MTNKETLREEFYKFCFGARENGLIFDWFYSKLEEIRNEDKKSLVEKINQRKTVKAQMVFKSYDEPVSNSGYLQGLDFVLDLIKQDER